MYYFLIYPGLNRVSVIRTNESTIKNLLLNIFTHIFAYFPHFTILSCVKQISNLSLRLKSRLLIIGRLLKQRLLNISHQIFQPYGGNYI